MFNFPNEPGKPVIWVVTAQLNVFKVSVDPIDYVYSQSFKVCTEGELTTFVIDDLISKSY